MSKSSEMLMFSLTEELRLINVKGMIQLENHYFAFPKTASAKNYKWMEPLAERILIDFTKQVITGCHHLNTLINLSILNGGSARYCVPPDVMQKKTQSMKHY